jgi:serine protease Do
MVLSSRRVDRFFAVVVIVSGACMQAPYASAAAQLSIGQVFNEVEGWTIGKNEALGGCLAAATYRDGTTVWVGFGGNGSGVLGFTNPLWKSIGVGQNYALRMQARGGRSWVGNFIGTERKDEKGVVSTNIKLDFLVDFARAGGISVFVDGKPIGRLSLVGSRAALDAAASCKNGEGQSASSSSKGQPSHAPESDSGYSGTGFFVSMKGHILTNNHVVKDCKNFWMAVPGSPRQVASVIATDETNDLALLITDTKQSSVPAFNTRPKVGQNIFVYGFPLTGVLASSGNFTVGNITATAGLNDDTRMVQISAPVQPGNSGGPVMDQNGNILGVLVSKLNALRIAKVTDDIPQNVNFAIKSSIATNFLESNNIYPNTQVSDRPLESTNLAELSRSFTVRVTCE